MNIINDGKLKYKSCEAKEIPQADIYTGTDPNPGEVLNGIPLYPDDVCANPRLRKFVVNGCQDVWAALLFIALVILTVVWGSINNARKFDGGHSTAPDDLDFSVVTSFWTLSVFFVLGVIGAFSSLILLRLFSQQIIYIANIITVVIIFFVSITLMASGAILGGLLTLLVAAMQLLWLYWVRKRIPFSAVLLKTSTDVLMQHKDIFAYNVLLGAVCMVFFYFWGAMAFTPAVKHEDGTGFSILFVFFLFILFWAMQVVPNLMHVTTAGVTATWYFAGEGQMPHNPTLHSFKRATTTSFGSICFGSLIVAVVRLLRWLAQNAGEHENEFVRCITVCIIQCLENLVEYFNTYAFVHVAVYGCGYIEAAKRTWALCKQCGFAAYFNDALISTTLGLLNLGISLLIGTVVGLMAREYGYGLFAFLVSLTVNFLFFTAVESAVTTLFVCFAELPEALQEVAPPLYAALRAADQNIVHDGVGRV